MLTDQEMVALFADFGAVDEADPAFLSATLQRLERERRRRARPWSRFPGVPVARGTRLSASLWLALLASLLLALALASTFAGGSLPGLNALLFGLPTASAVTSPSATPPGQLALITRTELPFRPSAIVVDSRGTPWVANGDQVTEIDPTTGAPGRSVSLGPGAASVIVDGSKLWVANHDANLVGRIDPATGVVEATVGVVAPDAIAVAGSVVWVLSDDQMTISRVDPVGMAVTLEIEIPGGSFAIAAGEDAVWVGRRNQGELSGSVVERLDPNTGRTVATITYAVQALPLDRIVISGGLVWLTDIANGRLVRLDPATNAQEAIPLGPSAHGLAAGPDGSLVVAYHGPGSDFHEANAIAIFDPSTEEFDRFVVRTDSPGAGRGVASIAFGDALWIAMDWIGDPSVGQFALP